MIIVFDKLLTDCIHDLVLHNRLRENSLRSFFSSLIQSFGEFNDLTFKEINQRRNCHFVNYKTESKIIEFFKKYPDSCHHPKEDIIYEKFKVRDPDRAASISDLQAEHREGAVRLRRVAQAIENVLNDEEVPREGVDRIVRDFIDNERKHIALEEEVVFPAIVDTLQPGDWADVALTLADRYGPPSAADFEEQFSTLRRNILELEEAAVARRS